MLIVRLQASENDTKYLYQYKGNNPIIYELYHVKGCLPQKLNVFRDQDDNEWNIYPSSDKDLCCKSVNSTRYSFSSKSDSENIWLDVSWELFFHRGWVLWIVGPCFLWIWSVLCCMMGRFQQTTFFFLSSPKKGFRISCKLTPDIICIKCQTIFCGKIKKNYYYIRKWITFLQHITGIMHGEEFIADNMIKVGYVVDTLPRRYKGRLVPESSTRVSFTYTRWHTNVQNFMEKKNVQCCTLCLGPTFKQVLSGPGLCIPDEKKKKKKKKKCIKCLSLFHR